MSLQNGSSITLVLNTPSYDIGISIPGKPTGSALIATIDIARQILVSVGNSIGSCGTTASAPAAFSVQQNGVTVLTITYPSATATATITGTDTVFNIGDTLSVISPTQDATLADVRFTLSAIKVGG